MQLGTDPEVFALDTSTGKHIPAFFALGGDVDIQLPHGTAYCDGAAIEFTVNPTDKPLVMASRMFENLRVIREHLKQINPAFELSNVSNAFFSKEEFIDKLPEELGKRASMQILGCDPDVTPYETDVIQRPDPKVYPYRTLGGHIHVEVPKYVLENIPAVHMLISALDQIVGVPVRRMCSSPADAQRRVLYGKAGYHRVKEYGIEYRVLPSRAITTNSALCASVFRRTQDTVQYVLNTYMPSEAYIDLMGMYNWLGGRRNNKAAVDYINGDNEALSDFIVPPNRSEGGRYGAIHTLTDKPLAEVPFITL